MKQIRFWIIIGISVYFMNCHSVTNENTNISVTRGDTTIYTREIFDFIHDLKNKKLDKQIWYISKCESCYDKYYFFTLKNSVSKFYNLSFDCTKFEVSIDSLPYSNNIIFKTIDSLMPFLTSEKMLSNEVYDNSGRISQSIVAPKCYYELAAIRDTDMVSSGRFYDADLQEKLKIFDISGKEREIDNLLLIHNNKSPWSKLLSTIQNEIQNLEEE